MKREKSPAYQRYPKKIMGDDIVLQMDWDAYGMHNWLLDIAWQQDPRGTIPNDQAVIRRWLRTPPNAVACARPEIWCRCFDCVWRRVWPQIVPAWPLLEDGRRGNSGMMRTAERQENYSRGNKGKEVHANCTQIVLKQDHKNTTDEDVGVAVDVGSGFRGDVAFEELCKVFPRAQIDTQTEQTFMDRVQKDSVSGKCSEQQAFDAILEKARVYADMESHNEITCVYGLRKWLYEGIYKQGPGLWVDPQLRKAALKREIDTAGARVGMH